MTSSVLTSLHAAASGFGAWITVAAAPLCVLALVYCLGGLHGLWMAWTQESRMVQWADRVCRPRAVALQNKLHDLEEKGRAS